MATELHSPTADHGDSSFSFSSSSAYVAGRQQSEHINVVGVSSDEHDENSPLLGSRSDSMASKTSMDMVEENEHAPRKGSLSAIDPNVAKHGDRALAIIGDERVSLTEEDNKRIRRKTDKVILTILIWAYFLQILDKSVLGYGATFGLKESTGLVGNQYSLVGSIAPIAQLAWQPFSSYLIVRVPHRILMPSLVLGWGIAQTCMAACHNYGGLLAARFFLGLFEGGCLPLFSIITSQWFRRAEQPIRVAAWYSTNGLATIAASILSFGLGHIQSSVLESWQIIFLFVGLVTVITAPFIYWFLDNDIPSARFLCDEDKPKAIERLRANQTGTGSREFKWSHVLELALDTKTYLWVSLSLLLNVGASVTNTFGPLIISGFGYDKFITSLMNMPFGALQFIIILLASWAAQRFRNKSIILACLCLPVIAGLAMLYTISHTDAHQGSLLAGYYLLAFLFGGNPLIVAWIVGNTAGTTKKSAVMSVYNAASSAGNIIGPLLFNSRDAPTYHPGLRAVLGIFVALAACVILQAFNLMFLNKLQERKRVKNGKPAKIKDLSMESKYQDNDGEIDVTSGVAEGQVEAGAQHARIGDQAFLDLTDRKNDEFVYIY
ncbi:putative transporter [Pseudocercospora fuligena]|uniref:Putative transporter n=1 Tax=Pseudocercospora fuligena TaxID=685502 RepID=A0A8H6RQ29_9PEZI|nr:putative transporter [Pseudocercospora fuligena]